MQVFGQTLRACLLGLTLTLGSVGCATVSPQEVAAAHFDQLPKDYQQQIKALISPGLKDPYSAVFRFEAPRRAFTQDGALRGGRKYYGFVVPTYVNAKNGFGGYTGEELSLFMWENGHFYNVSDAFTNSMGGYIP